MIDLAANGLIRFKWNKDTYSCAYDSLFSILFHLFSTETEHWMADICMQNQYLEHFTAVTISEVRRNHSLWDRASAKILRDR